MAVKAYNTITLISIDDVNISMTEPENPVVDQLWLDTSKEPNELMRYDGTGWVRTQHESVEELDPSFKTEYDNQITSLGTTITERTTVGGEPVAEVVTELIAGELIIRDTIRNGGHNILKNPRFGATELPDAGHWYSGGTVAGYIDWYGYLTVNEFLNLYGSMTVDGFLTTSEMGGMG